MSAKDPALSSSRIGNSTRTPQAADDVSVTDWSLSAEMVFEFQLDEQTGPWNNVIYKCRWRQVGGSYADLGAATEIAYGTSTDLVQNSPCTPAEAMCTNDPGGTAVDGIESEGAAAPTTTVSLADEDYCSCQYALDFSNADYSQEYEFEIYDVTNGAAIGTATATVTTEEEPYTPVGEVFADGFEDGTDNAWTTQQGTPTVSASGLASTSYKCDIAVNTTEDWEEKTIAVPIRSNVFRYRYYVDPNGQTSMDSDVMLTRLLSVTGDVGQTYLDYSGGFRIYASITNDASSETDTGFYSISDDEHYVEVLYKRATTDVAADGSLQLWIDGVSKETVSNIDNYDQWVGGIDEIRFGNANYTGTNQGDIYVDEFVIRDDDTEIGAVAGAIDIPINAVKTINIDAYDFTVTNPKDIGINAVKVMQITARAFTVTNPRTIEINAVKVMQITARAFTVTNPKTITTNAVKVIQITARAFTVQRPRIITINAVKVVQITVRAFTISNNKNVAINAVKTVQITVRAFTITNPKTVTTNAVKEVQITARAFTVQRPRIINVAAVKVVQITARAFTVSLSKVVNISAVKTVQITARAFTVSNPKIVTTNAVKVVQITARAFSISVDAPKNIAINAVKEVQITARAFTVTNPKDVGVNSVKVIQITANAFTVSLAAPITITQNAVKTVQITANAFAVTNPKTVTLTSVKTVQLTARSFTVTNPKTITQSAVKTISLTAYPFTVASVSGTVINLNAVKTVSIIAYAFSVTNSSGFVSAGPHGRSRYRPVDPRFTRMIMRNLFEDVREEELEEVAEVLEVLELIDM